MDANLEGTVAGRRRAKVHRICRAAELRFAPARPPTPPGSGQPPNKVWPILVNIRLGRLARLRGYRKSSVIGASGFMRSSAQILRSRSWLDASVSWNDKPALPWRLFQATAAGVRNSRPDHSKVSSHSWWTCSEGAYSNRHPSTHKSSTTTVVTELFSTETRLALRRAV